MSSPNQGNSNFLESKLLLPALLVLTLIITGVSMYVLHKIESLIRRDIASTLQPVLDTTHEALNIWVGERKRDISSWALSPQLITAIQNQLAVYEGHKDLNGPGLAEIDEILQSSIMQLGYLGYMVFSPDHAKIASLLKFQLGENTWSEKHRDMLNRAFKGETLIGLPEVSDTSVESDIASDENLNMFSATPVRDNHNKIIAVLVFRFDPAFNFIQIPKLGRTGETGETYLFNKEGLLISESRFDKHLRDTGIIPPQGKGLLTIKISDPGGNLLTGHKPSPRSQQPLTQMAQAAIAGKSGINLDGYRDYRGVPVVGAWLWDDALQLGMTTEIDYDEAYGSFNTTRRMIFTLVFGIIAMFVAFTIAHTLTARKRLAFLEALHTKDILMSALVDNMGDGVITIDSKGIIHSFNPAAERMFGYHENEILGQNISMLTPHPHREKHDEYIQNYLKTGKPKVIDKPRDVLACKKSGELFPINLSVAVMLIDNSLFFTGITRDITEKLRADNQLKESEQRLSLALEALNGGTWDWDLTSNKILFSSQWLKTFGYEPGDISSYEDWQKLVHPEDLATINAIQKKNAESGISRHKYVYRILHKSGQWRWSYNQGMVVNRDEHGKPVRLAGLDTDITEFKKIEEELNHSRNQLRELTSHIFNAQEEERKKISREIHDDLGQALTVIRMNMAWMARKLTPDQTDILDKVESLSRLTDNTINTMRRIASGLRPQILEDLGLRSAIESHSREINKQTGLECHFNFDVEDMEIGKDIAFTLFRIYQEAITNVIRHAQADKATITLKKCGNEIILKITDNGQGIKEDLVVFPIRKSFGLLGIKERAAMYGGIVEIVGIPGNGTSITISLPHQPLKQDTGK